jgi:hypothetical protein
MGFMGFGRDEPQARPIVNGEFFNFPSDDRDGRPYRWLNRVYSKRDESLQIHRLGD